MSRPAARAKTVYACAECGHASPKWLGQCPSCRRWNTLHEEVAAPEPRGAPRGFSGAAGSSRPLPLRDNELMESWHKQRHVVLPGLTGLWQVSGRSNTSYDYRIALDLWYVRNWNLWLDVVILLRTIYVVAKKEGAK